MAESFNPVGWFEIPVQDLKRAKAFYEHLLGVALSVQASGPVEMALFPMRQGATGSSGALVRGQGFAPANQGQGVTIYFTAPDLEAACARAAQQGGKVLQPRTSIGEYGFIARLLDPEGNVIALHSAA